MSGELILAIDQGTTNTKAILVDTSGAVVAEASERVPITFPRPGWVESDGMEVWRTVQKAVRASLEKVADARPAAVAVANQRESVLAWERATGRPLGPLVSWQCRRSAGICDDLRARDLEPTVRERTGLGIDPMFSATKARWLLDHIDDGDARAARGEIAIGTVDAWLAWNLSGGTVFATDATNASRTLLLDLERLAWDEGMLEVFGIPAATLPQVRGSSAVLGVTGGEGPVPAGVPIAALVGDSHAALFGHGAPLPGSVKATYGTGTSVMAPLPAPLRSEVLSSTVAWSTERPMTSGAAEEGDVRLAGSPRAADGPGPAGSPRAADGPGPAGSPRAADGPGPAYGPPSADGPGPAIAAVQALEGNITATGAAIAWLASLLEREGREAELEALAASVPDAGGVVLVPAFTGLGAPHWDAGARGLICGLSRGTTRAHLARATFDSVAFQVRDVLDALAPAVGTPLTALYADGGAMQSDLLAQLQADVTDLPVLRNRSGSLAALGAAYLAGLAIGTWGSLAEVRALPRVFDRFEPRPDQAVVADAGHAAWRVALRRAAGDLGTEA